MKAGKGVGQLAYGKVAEQGMEGPQGEPYLPRVIRPGDDVLYVGIFDEAHGTPE